MALDLNMMVFKVPSVAVEVTAKVIGIEFAAGHSRQEAAILLAMAEDIEGWPQRHSWPVQCRMIVAALSREEAKLVSGVLGVLMEHLDAVTETKQPANYT